MIYKYVNASVGYQSRRIPILIRVGVDRSVRTLEKLNNPTDIFEDEVPFQSSSAKRELPPDSLCLKRLKTLERKEKKTPAERRERFQSSTFSQMR